MKVLVVYAHPEPKQSFNGALLRKGIETLRQEGHDVKVSDLYEMEFNAVASPADFTSRRFPDRLQYDREQKQAVQLQGFSDDIQTEIDKVFWCDFLILQFPLWWFSMPAIMKGWFDRVFVNTRMYGAGMRFETGGLRGRKAMVCLTTGAFEPMFDSDGLLGDLEVALWHIHNGMLHYTGFDVLPPFVAWSPAHQKQEVCERYLEEYANQLRHLDDQVPLDFHYTSETGPDFKLLPDIEPRSVGHRRK